MNKPKSLLSEDILAIVTGFFFLLTGFVAFYALPFDNTTQNLQSVQKVLETETSKPFKTVAWYQAQDKLKAGQQNPIGDWLTNLVSEPKSWKFNPLQSILSPRSQSVPAQNLQVLEVKALAMEHAAWLKSFRDADANEVADKAAKEWFKASRTPRTGPGLIVTILFLGMILALVFGIGTVLRGGDFYGFARGSVGVFVLSVIAIIMGKQTDMNNLGFGYALWAIVLGMIISNTVGTPTWMKPALQTEYFIKTGLVILGAEVLFGKILAIGLPGIFVAWIVTPIVLVVTFWFGQRILKITSKSLNITISADMSVCGVSAAIATAAASKATKEELTIAVGLSMVFTSVMMVVLPAFIRLVGMPEVLGGAWIGGTLDATGAVVAAGAFLGDTALQVAATIKMIQNMLIGVISFFVAYYFATRIEGKEKSKVSLNEVWLRFPKFVLGFIAASILFSALHAASDPAISELLIDQGVIKGFTKNLHSWLFCLAFMSIGLSVNFRELRSHFKGGKPLVLYVSGQALNLLLTLLMAFIMFYLVFPEITQSLEP